jgi:serine protease
MFYCITPYHSYGRSEGGSLEFERVAFQQIYDDGVLLVATAGNQGSSQDNWPASYDSVISVAGTYSCRNNTVRL